MGAQESKSSNSKDYIAATYETSTVLVRKGSDYHVSEHLGFDDNGVLMICIESAPYPSRSFSGHPYRINDHSDG